MHFGQHWRIVGYCSASLVICSPPTAAVASEAVSAEEQQASGSAAIGETLVSGHGAVSRRVGEAADYLDRFFVDERIDEGYNQTRLRIRLGVRGAEGGRSRFSANVSLNLALPRTQQRVSLIVQSLTDDNEDENDPNSLTDRDRDLVSGLRLYLFDGDDAQINLDAGLRFRPDPRPRLRLRGQYEVQLGNYLIRPAQQFFWRAVDGAGEITRLDVDRSLGVRGLARLRTEVQWSEDIAGIEVRPEIILYQSITDLAALRLRLGTVVATEPATVLRDYELSIRYRWSFFRPWLFFEVEPGILLERRRNYEFSPELTVRVETLLGPRYVESRVEGGGHDR